MKKFAIFAVLAALALCIGGVAKADTCPAGSTNCLQGGGVTYTFTNSGSDGGGVFDVNMVVSGPLPSTGLTSFSVFFTSGSNMDTAITLESAPGGIAQWTVLPGQQNTNNGCSNATSTPFTCFTGGTVADGTYVFDVTISGAPDGVDLKIGQGSDFAISQTTGVGGTTPPPPTPEPASMLLLGLGLAGVPFLRRKK